MWVESQVGQGSTFHVTIVAPAAPSPVRVDGPGLQNQLRGKRVLIVDDNAANRQILAHQVEAWGVLAQATGVPAEALEWIRRGEPYDLAILDMQMPEMDGLMLASAIRQYRDASTLPLVMVTSLGQRKEDPQAGVDFVAWLTKPIKSSSLYNALVSVFAAHPRRVREPAATGQFDTQLAQRVPLRILLAEDNEVNQRLAVRMLEKQGHSVAVACNGREALDALGRERFDLVLMDVQMPEMGGFDATAALRMKEEGAGRRTPVIAMTAHAMKGDRERCLEAGMDGYVSKPIKAQKLYEEIERVAPAPTGAKGNGSPSPALAGGQTVTNLGPAPAFDHAAAVERAGGDAELLNEIAGMFLDEHPRWLSNVRDALAAGDPRALGSAAHSLKGAAGNLCAQAVCDAAQRLETIAEGGDLSAAGNVLALLNAETLRLSQALELYYKNHAHAGCRG
jgi:CheY-like chemotaxis protein/HPt (histidine-containing phosphotransfer) domain-containing protein